VWSALLVVAIVWIGCTSFDDAVLPATARDAARDADADANAAPAEASGAGPPSFCKLNHHDFFCDDFDQGLLGAAWDAVHSGPNGSLVLDTTPTLFQSAPASLEAQLTGKAVGRAQLEKKWDGPFTSVRCEMKVSPAAPLNGEEFDVVKVSFVASGGVGWAGLTYGQRPVKTSLLINSTATGTDANGGPFEEVSFDALVEKAWNAMALEITADGTSLHARALLEGDAGSETQAAEQTVPLTGTVSSVTLLLGPAYFYAADGPSWATHYDDVFCDLQ
jgi:hypothetical protein